MSARAVGPLFVVNPVAGGGRGAARFRRLERAIADAFPKGYAVRVSSGPGAARALAAEGANGGHDPIIAVGGDGTLSEVADGVQGSAAPWSRVGLLHGGSGGDFARSAGPLGTFGEQLARWRSARFRPLDLLTVACADEHGAPLRRTCVNVVSAGMGGAVDRFVARYRGFPFAYMAASALAAFATPRTTLLVELDDHPAVRMESNMLALCNGAFFGGGMHVAPMARVDDGHLELVSLAADGPLQLLAGGVGIYVGEHLQAGGATHRRARRCRIALAEQKHTERFALDLDGEGLGLLPMTVQVAPAALHWCG